jgi:hypothetical protein
MFLPKTQRINDLAQYYPQRIAELETIFQEKTNIYIDWANIFGLQEKLKWHIDLKRVYQLFRSFSTVYKIRRYYGTLCGDSTSEKIIQETTNI